MAGLVVVIHVEFGRPQRHHSSASSDDDKLDLAAIPQFRQPPCLKKQVYVERTVLLEFSKVDGRAATAAVTVASTT
jgi:hypothetical protein